VLLLFLLYLSLKIFQYRHTQVGAGVKEEEKRRRRMDENG
jgi:hypothetical protein